MDTNTVLRASRILHDDRLLEFQRGRGTTVAGCARPKTLALIHAQELVRLARQEGFLRGELLRLIKMLP
jgi:GntR family transcriptional regulator